MNIIHTRTFVQKKLRKTEKPCVFVHVFHSFSLFRFPIFERKVGVFLLLEEGEEKENGDK